MTGSGKVLVLGGGMCGLYAARVLAGRGIPVTVLEKGPAPGGLAAGREIGGNHYDLGVHHLHASDKGIFEDMKDLLGGQLRPSVLEALIHFGGGWRRYPLEFGDLLGGVPLPTLVRMLGGLAAQSARNKLSREPARNAEEALIRLYGRPLYERFFRDFTTEYWGVPPTGLSATFVSSRMPRLGGVDVVKRALAAMGMGEEDAATPSATARETVWYTPSGSGAMAAALAGRIREDGGEVLLDSEVAAVVTEGGRVTAVETGRGSAGRRFPCTDCISTIPLPELVRSLVPAAPVDVLEASGRLRYRPVAVYGLLVSKPAVLEAHFAYFRNRLFHRLAEPKRGGLEVQPPGHSVLLAETTCDKGDERWEGGEAARRRLLDDLEEEGLARRDEVAEVHILRSEHGYPVFEIGFERHLQRAQAFLAALPNLSSVGRQGGFLYPNMHAAMRMGAAAAEAVVARRAAAS